MQTRWRRAHWIAILVTAFVAACTSGSLNLDDLSPQSGSGTGRAPRFADNDPHDWADRAPWTYAVHGTDVAKYQNRVDWPKAKASGIAFAFIKATEGGDRVDERFLENWNATRLHGIPRSAYHFYYFCRPAIEQAQWFIRNVPREASSLPHVLDMEWNPQSPTCKLRPDAATVRSEMRIFLEALTRHYGKKPIIYTSIDFWEDNGLDRFRGYDWWLRSVSAHPHERYGRRNFRFWQYTGTGVVPGIEGDADINVFNGSRAEWKAWLRSNTR